MHATAREVVAPFRGVDLKQKREFKAAYNAVFSQALAIPNAFEFLLAVVEVTMSSDVLIAHCACEAATVLRKSPSKVPDLGGQLAAIADRATSVIADLLKSDST